MKFIKCESWKWWSTPLYYILLPFQIVRYTIWWLKHPDPDEPYFWFMQLAQAECDIRTGRFEVGEMTATVSLDVNLASTVSLRDFDREEALASRYGLPLDELHYAAVILEKFTLTHNGHCVMTKK